LTPGSLPEISLAHVKHVLQTGCIHVPSVSIHLAKNTIQLAADVLSRLLLKDIGDTGIHEAELIVALEHTDGIEVIREVVNALIPNCPDPSTSISICTNLNDSRFAPISIVGF
jgi:DUF1009 family protein